MPKTRHTPRRIVTVSLIVLALIVTSCSFLPGNSGPTMTLATPTWNPGVASVAVSEKLGYFDDEGLDMDVILVDSGTTQVTQVGSGRVTTGALSPEPLIIGRQPGKDLDLTYYMSFYKKNIYGLAVPENSPIQSINDLKGKKVGAISLASVAVTQTKVGLKHVGVPPDSVRFIAIGAGSQQAAAIRQGDVDAVALLDTSFEVLKNQGIGLRMITVPGTENLTSGGLAARSADLQKNRKTYEKIGRAVAKGVTFSAANPEAAVKILYQAHPEAKPSGLSDSAAIASAVKILKARLANLGADAPPGEYGTLAPQMLAANQKFLRDAGLIKTQVPIEKLFTNSLIPEINRYDYEVIRNEALNYGK